MHNHQKEPLETKTWKKDYQEENRPMEHRKEAHLEEAYQGKDHLEKET